MIPLPQLTSCAGCGGSCCREQGAPPIRPSDREAIPATLLAEVDEFKASAAYQPKSPCLWQDAFSGLCRHYEHRPSVCREFALGGVECHAIRRLAGIEPSVNHPRARKSFFATLHCTSRAHCHACRTSRRWRESIARTFDTGGMVDFPCPIGLITGEESRGLGDAIKKVADATGIGAVVRWVTRRTGKPCGCGQRQAALNTRFPFRP